ncbi:9101_t:CDS:2 [Dentiscutata erythropus]|uniref:9101_t:CDS:1 n=1 Tax=Dentiscutata erythropus TaxID=1348616 RepID=A0A9N9IXY8_9GLOM|nr:9101_t:CDS:2 [Dentiscutata erythropus]
MPNTLPNTSQKSELSLRENMLNNIIRIELLTNDSFTLIINDIDTKFSANDEFLADVNDLSPIDLSNNIYIMNLFYRIVKRNILRNTFLSSIGISSYEPYNYIYSHLSLNPNFFTNNQTTILISLLSDYIEVETEQRSRSIIDILGTIVAIYDKELNKNVPYGFFKRLTWFGGPSDKPIIKRFTEPLEKSLIERIEELESIIIKKNYLVENVEN